MPKRSIDNKFLESLIDIKLGEKDSSQIKPITSSSEVVESLKETIKKLELDKQESNQIKEIVKSTKQELTIVSGCVNRGMNVCLPQIIKQMVKTNSRAEVDE